MNNTRRRILLCARDLYLHEGGGAFSMRRVAGLAGISAPAIYRHYESRQQLLVAVVVEGYKLFEHYLQRGLRESTASGRLAATGRAYVDFALEHPRDYNLIFTVAQPWPECALPEPAATLSRNTFQFLVAQVEACRRDGVLAVQDTDSAALAIWAHSHGLVSLYLSGHFGEDETAFRERWTHSVDVLFAGLLHPAEIETVMGE